MQSLPLALILCSSAVLAIDTQDVVNAASTVASTAQVDVPVLQPIVASGAHTGKYTGGETILVNGQKYLITYDSEIRANGRLNFTSFENAAAEGALSSSGKIVIDSLGQFGYTLDMNGRASYVNNILNVEGAIRAIGSQGDQKVDVAANGFLTCHKSNMTCTRVMGSYDVSIITNWLKYGGQGNVNGVAAVVNGNVAFGGAHTSQSAGSWQYVNNQIVWVPVQPVTGGVSTPTKETKTTTTMVKKPTSTPTVESGAGAIGASMMAVAAGVAAFFF
jgi:hypothetical protein